MKYGVPFLILNLPFSNYPFLFPLPGSSLLYPVHMYLASLYYIPGFVLGSLETSENKAR